MKQRNIFLLSCVSLLSIEIAVAESTQKFGDIKGGENAILNNPENVTINNYSSKEAVDKTAKIELEQAIRRATNAERKADIALEKATEAKKITDEIVKESGGISVTPLLSGNSKSSTSSASGNLIDNHYRDNGDGTATDVKTGLQWMRCSLGQTWDSSTCQGEAAKVKHGQAMNIPKSIEYAGYNDWQVPTDDELRTLIYCSSGSTEELNKNGGLSTQQSDECGGDYSRPTIAQDAFPNTPKIIWSSDNAYCYNYVSFHYGYTGCDFGGRGDSNDSYAVRLVRRGK
ncbi:MAG: DUF1566 domain-containing protein [Methylococcales bacterium]